MKTAILISSTTGVHTFYPNTFVYHDKEQMGKSYGLNQLLDIDAAITKEYDLLAFTDDDTIPAWNWIQELEHIAEANPDVDVFGGRVDGKLPDGMQLPWRGRDINALLGINNLETPHENVVMNIWGTNMAIRRHALKAIRFNEGIGPRAGQTYVVGCETDLLVRMWLAGHKMMIAPQARVQHIVRSEQLTPDWLLKRAYMQGMGTAHIAGLLTSPLRVDIKKQIQRGYMAYNHV